MKRTSIEMEEMVNALEGLWREVLPSLEVPFRSRLRGWLEIGTLPTVEYAIRRTARKCWRAGREGRPMNSGQCRAYCQHVLEHEMEMQQAGDGWSVVKEEQEARAQ